MRPLRRLAMLALAATTMATMTACDVGDAIGPDGSINATFTLRTLNGYQLPYTFSNGLTLVRDELTFYRNGTYVDVSTYGDGTTSTEEGYYTNTNGSIYFEPRTSGAPYQGSLSNDTLTEIVNGYTQVFRRR